MTQNHIQDLLPLVEKPSRYLGDETNRVKKDPAEVNLSVALVFPDLYEIGTSHFGMQILYHMLNQRSGIAAERVFAPAEDMQAALRSARRPLASLETRRPLNRFDILGFSLLYELNYTNMLTILELAGIPFYGSQRDESFPLVIAGGPCTSNPEPVADFFDAMVVGDGEGVLLAMTDIWLQHKQNGSLCKDNLLKDWSCLQGVYVPSYYRAEYDGDGFQRLIPMDKDATEAVVVKRAILKSLNQAPFPTSPVVPFGKPVHDRLRLEISRGCTRGCRFCQAGMIYRPVRERSPQTLFQLVDDCLQNTGYDEISLLSLSTGDYTCLSELIEGMMNRYESKNVAVSLPSLRAGTLSSDLMKSIKRVRKTGFTIAPEAGSQRLRNVINKNISEADIEATVSNAFAMGWQLIKLYFMVGLPTETEADVAEIVRLADALRKTKTATGRFGRINVSVATFIPKPHTPFQWASQMSLPESMARIDGLKSKLKLPGVQMKWQNPEVSFLEGLWARGDRRLSRLLVQAHQNGCRFDGWSDRFQFQRWERSMSDSGIDPSFYITRKRHTNEPLPWDHIDMGVDKSFLQKEWERAYQEAPTSDCRRQACQECGVCDFKEVAPELFDDDPTNDAVTEATPSVAPGSGITYGVTYSKTGDARFFGHLEMMNIFLRALRRLQVPLLFSQGFHPLPKVSFEDPLPVGMESLEERFFISVSETLDAESLPSRLNRELPEGLTIKSCRLAAKKRKRPAERINRYLIRLADGEFDRTRLEWFRRTPTVTLQRKDKKGRVRIIDIKELVLEVDFLPRNSLSLTIRQTEAKTVRPAEILSAVFGLAQDQIKTATIIKGTIHV